ncbi:polysaccharide biosynthesis protein [Oleiphilus messinensis]|uniref:Polysaccharide biosynthesis protein n=1 Tax=Oleiphilus messinensis TaxID=141451 RepID=A0A1Y0IG95_9GAMM|nr:oligosaccharide flippase family protein [Oleiphilus messinensis]ARU59518.1 polysaccharide biosynthesis protein [Oleiphilus messinensis]
MIISRTLKSAILALGQFLNALIGVICVVVLTRVFDKQDFASFSQAVLAFTFVLPFLALGLHRAPLYFMAGETVRSRGLLGETLILLTFMGMLFSLFLLLGGNKLLADQFNNPGLASLLNYLAPYSLVALPILALPACLTAMNKVQQVPMFTVVSRFIALVMVLLGACYWQTPSAALVGLTISGFLVLPWALGLMYRSCSGQLWPNYKSLVAQVKFAIPVGIAAVLGAVQVQLDKLFVASMGTPEEFAVFVIGAQQLPVVAMITGSVATVTLVDLRQFYLQGRLVDLVHLWQSALLKVAVFMIPIMILGLVLADDVIPFLFTAAYAEAVLPFQLYLLLLFGRMANYGNLLVAGGNPQFLPLVLLITVIAGVSLNWVLIPEFGYMGAVYGTLIASYCVEIPLHLLLVRWRLGVWMFSGFNFRLLSKILFCALIAAGASLLCKQIDHILMRMIMVTCVYLVILLLTYRTTGIAAFIGLKSHLITIKRRGLSNGSS